MRYFNISIIFLSVYRSFLVLLLSYSRENPIKSAMHENSNKKERERGSPVYKLISRSDSTRTERKRETTTFGRDGTLSGFTLGL